MVDLPYQVRFRKPELNYLFVGILYMVLALLIIIRILIIKPKIYRKPLLAIGMMTVVFPCSFILSVCLENFDRIKRMHGIDMYMQLVDESISNGVYIRNYKKANLSLAQLHGFGNNSATYTKESIWDNTYKRYIPTTKITRNEENINPYLKLISTSQ